MTPNITVRLFGSIEILINGTPIPRLRSRKVYWLLAILALRSGREISRDTLVGLLWPDAEPAQGYASLRKALNDLRTSLGSESARLTNTGQHGLQLDVANIFVDALEFDKLVRSSSPTDIAIAADLYRGTLVEDCFEDWVLVERESREQALVMALESLSRMELASCELSKATTTLRRLLLMDPYRETAHRAIMEALASSGNFAAASLHYRDYRIRLRQDMNTSPSPETVALYELLRVESRKRATPPESLRIPMMHVSVSVSAASDTDERQADEDATVAVVPDRRSLASSSRKVRVPHPITKLIGRTAEIAAIQSHLSTVRLLTLIGPGGVGKTRLGIHAAKASANQFEDGVYFVDLAIVQTENQVANAVAAATELKEELGALPQESITRWINDKSALLIFDNCEHVLNGAARLAAEIISACPKCVILATSRQPLGICGEQTYGISTLSVPSAVEATANGLQNIAQFAKFESIQLFLERASSVIQDFALTEENAEAIADICRRLDGLPLAIELAVPRLRALSPSQVLDRIEDRFRLLTTGDTTRLKRQQTLRALIDWSYDMLSSEEQYVLRSLSVFAGEFSLQAAEAVAGNQTNETSGVQSEDVWELVASLVDKSLLVSLQSGGNQMYRLLESIKAYSVAKAKELNEELTHKVNHARHCLAIADYCAETFRSRERVESNAAQIRYADDMRLALDFCESNSMYADIQMGILISMWRPWMAVGLLQEGSSRTERALQIEIPANLLPRRVEVLIGASGFAWNQSNYDKAMDFLREALAIATQIGLNSSIAQIVFSMGVNAHACGDYCIALRHYQESLTMWRKVGDLKMQTDCLNNIGIALRTTGDYPAAANSHIEARTLSLQLNDPLGAIAAAVGIGNVYMTEGNLVDAEAMFREAMQGNQELGERESAAGCIMNIASILCIRDRPEEAHELLIESLRIMTEIGSTRGEADVLDNFADVYERLHRPGDAVLVCGVSDAFRKQIKTPRTPQDEANSLALHNRLLTVVSQEAFDKKYLKGQRMGYVDAFKFITKETGNAADRNMPNC